MSSQPRHAARTREWPALPAGRAPLTPGMAPAAERRSVRRLIRGFTLAMFAFLVVTSVDSAQNELEVAGYFLPSQAIRREFPEVRWVAIWSEEPGESRAHTPPFGELRVRVADARGQFADVKMARIDVSERSVAFESEEFAGTVYRFDGMRLILGNLAQVAPHDEVALAGLFEAVQAGEVRACAYGEWVYEIGE